MQWIFIRIKIILEPKCRTTDHINHILLRYRDKLNIFTVRVREDFFFVENCQNISLSESKLWILKIYSKFLWRVLFLGPLLPPTIRKFRLSTSVTFNIRKLRFHSGQFEHILRYIFIIQSYRNILIFLLHSRMAIS